MSHRTNSWYTTALRRTLAAVGIRGIDTLDQPGLTGADVMHSGTAGAAILQVGHNHRGRLYDRRPAPRFIAARQAWDDACDHIAHALVADGYPEPTRSYLGLYVQVPDEKGTPAAVTVTPNAVMGRYTVEIDGAPDLAASIDGSLQVSTVQGYALLEGGQYLGRSATVESAARAYALARGFGPQITVTYR